MISSNRGRIKMNVLERLAKTTATQYIIPGSDEWPAGLDDHRPAESVPRRRGEPVGCGCAVPDISPA